MNYKKFFCGFWMFIFLGFLAVVIIATLDKIFKQKSVFFRLDRKDKYNIYLFVFLCFLEIWFLGALKDFDSLNEEIFNYVGLVFSLLLLVSSAIITMVFKKYLNDRDTVKFILLLLVFQVALVMIVASETVINIYLRLLANVIYLVIPAYVIFALTEQTKEK